MNKAYSPQNTFTCICRNQECMKPIYFEILEIHPSWSNPFISKYFLFNKFILTPSFFSSLSGLNLLHCFWLSELLHFFFHFWLRLYSTLLNTCFLSYLLYRLCFLRSLWFFWFFLDSPLWFWLGFRFTFSSFFLLCLLFLFDQLFLFLFFLLFPLFFIFFLL